MYKKLIPCIYLYKGNAVKGFSDSTILNTNPAALGKFYGDNSADELIVYDLSEGDAEHEEALDIIKSICAETEIPVIGAGNVHRMEDIKKLLYAGCKKAALNYSKEENIEIIVRQIMDLNKKESAGILLLKKQYTCVKRNIRNIVDAIADGFYNDSVKDKLLKLEKDKADLEMQIEIEKENVSKLTLTEEQIRFWLSNILTLIPESKKSILVDTFVDEIVYFDDNND